MKNYLKTLAVGALALTIGLGTVEAATASQKINANACETVYTNYYFFLDANTESFFNKSELSKITHDTVARYMNNSYQINDFDYYNVGYGQVQVNRTTSTSKDGITSMSLTDFYNVALKASKISGGSYSEGSKNYIVAHDWYSINADGTAKPESGILSIANLSVNQLKNATVDANSTFTRETQIHPDVLNPFVVKIERSYYGYLTGTPFRAGNHNWYVHPAVYYVQYCKTKQADEEPEKREYRINYYENGSNVTNMPRDERALEGECLYVSSREPKREGYEFLGWSESSKATRPDWYKNDRYCGTKGDLDLYAIWKKKETPVEPSIEYYNIYYKENTTDTVVGMPADSLDIPNDRDAYIAKNVPVRNGYSFVGWGLTQDATTPDYKANDLYEDRKDLTLYAIWKKNPDPVLPPVPDNPQTGIEDYILPLGGIALVSGLGLKYMRKRIYDNL